MRPGSRVRGGRLLLRIAGIIGVTVIVSVAVARGINHEIVLVGIFTIAGLAGYVAARGLSD